MVIPLRGRQTGESGRLRTVMPGASLGLTTGDCLVCIPVAGALSVFADCFVSVLKHTPLEVPILVADDAGPEGEMMELLGGLEAEGLLAGQVFYARSPETLGLVRSANLALAGACPADIILLNSDCVVAESWYEGMRAAAYVDSIVATSSAFSNNGSILTIPGCASAAPGTRPRPTLVECAAAIRASSPRLRPRIPTAVGHCMYIRRSALDLVGDFDLAFSPGYGEEVDLSQRCAARGLTHVAADDVFVWHAGGASFSDHEAREELRNSHERLLAKRYPMYHRMADAAATATSGPLARARAAARHALSGISITVDISYLVSTVTGTHVYALEFIRALAQQNLTPLRVVVPRHVDQQVRELLVDAPSLEIRYVDDIGPDIGQTDVVHRPFQAPTPADLERLRWLGEHIVITQLDLIAYRNATYFPDYASWHGYRSITREALAACDMVFFLSRHPADDAIAEDLIDPGRAHVVPVGTDHRHFGHARPVRPKALRADTEPYILCLGTDFNHKNRLFAMETLAELQRRHNWQGSLVLAGPRAAQGSSAAEEARYRRAHPPVNRATVRLAEVTEAEKSWLLSHAAAVFCPTVYEGFGLVPFEAAALGVPCIFAAQTALGEVLPSEVALLVPWDAAATSDNVHELITDSDMAEGVVAAIHQAGTRFTWEGVAQTALDLYAVVAGETPSETESAEPQLAPTARHLVGTDGVLPEDVQEAVWALSRRAGTSKAFFLAMRQVHRAGKSVRRLATRSGRDL